jgi:hypothetical protein
MLAWDCARWSRSVLLLRLLQPTGGQTFRQRTLRFGPTRHLYPRGRQLLDIFKMEHLELAEPSELQPFIQLDKEVRELKAQVTAQNGHGGCR